MELTQLKYFQAAAKYENLSEASKYLNITQPTLSASISRLEQELGLPLFDRRGKKIRLNLSGQTFLEYVQEILELSDIAVRVTRKQYESTLLICTSAAILSQYLIPMFCAEYPQYQVDPQMMEEGEILKLLRRGSIDIALISAPVALEEYCCTPLCRDYAGMSVPLSDHLSARESLTREDLRGKVVIRENNTSIVSQLAQKYVDQAPDIRYIYQNDQSATYTYAQKSDKMAFYSSLGSQMSLQIKGRRFIPFAKKEGVFLTYYLIYRSNAVKSREILDAVQWMRSYFRPYNRKVAALMAEQQPLA